MYILIFMDEKEIQELRRKVDDILDLYFEELADCFEKKRDIQGLRGWLRVHLHDAIIKTHAGRESLRNKYVYQGIIALLAISIVNLILLFFRYIFDPV